MVIFLTCTVIAAPSTVSAEDTEKYIAADKHGQPVLEVMFRNTYKIVYDDHDTGARLDGAAWVIEPKSIPEEFYQLGHIFGKGRTNPTGKHTSMIVRDISRDRNALRSPTGASFVWNDRGSGGTHDLEVFTLNCPDNYVAVGAVVRGDGGGGWGVGALPPGQLMAAKLKQFACVRSDLTDYGKITELLWSDAGSGANGDFSAWGMTYVDPLPQYDDGALRLNSGSFVANASHAKPENTRAIVLKFFIPNSQSEMRKWMSRAQRGG